MLFPPQPSELGDCISWKQLYGTDARPTPELIFAALSSPEIEAGVSYGEVNEDPQGKPLCQY